MFVNSSQPRVQTHPTDLILLFFSGYGSDFCQLNEENQFEPVLTGS